MTIETKYNIGDEVWFIYSDRVRCEKIKDVRACRNGYKQYDATNYGFKDYDTLIPESDIFPTKLDLLNSL